MFDKVLYNVSLTYSFSDGRLREGDVGVGFLYNPIPQVTIQMFQDTPRVKPPTKATFVLILSLLSVSLALSLSHPLWSLSELVAVDTSSKRREHENETDPTDDLQNRVTVADHFVI